ncbi:hypothetical protein Ddc_09971 [Ditylenchus destructor]|nr:hypothetical protein Ddc_09971 [Ditylenchus destructor]
MDNNAHDARFFRMVEELILGYFGRQKMFYENGNFAVPNCFTEFGDRLRQMTNEFTSLVGCYSTNQRILYGKNIASRKRNSTKNVRASEDTEIISSSTSEVNNPESDLSIIGILTTNGKNSQQCATQPGKLSLESNAMTTLHTSQQAELVSSDTHNDVTANLERNEENNRHINFPGNRCTTPTYIIDSPNELSLAQTLDNLPSDMLPSVSSTQVCMPGPSYENFDSSNNYSDDFAETMESLVKEPTGRDVSSIRQTIRAHMEKRKRRKPMSQQQKIKNTIEKIASLANKTETPKHDSELERYIDAPDFLTNFDDWFEGINFNNLEGIEVMTQDNTNVIKTNPTQLQRETSSTGNNTVISHGLNQVHPISREVLMENSVSIIEPPTTKIVTERTSWQQMFENATQITDKISNDAELSSRPDAQTDLSNSSSSCSQPSGNATKYERQAMHYISGDTAKEQIRKRLQSAETDRMSTTEISNGIIILSGENRSTLDTPECKKSKMGKVNCTDEIVSTVDSMLRRDDQNSEPFDPYNTDFNVTDATQLAEAEMNDRSQLEEGELCSPEKTMSKSYKWKTRHNERSSSEVSREKRDQSPGFKEIIRKGPWKSDRHSSKENSRKQFYLKELQAIQPKPQCTPTKPKHSGSLKSKHESRNERKTTLRHEMNHSNQSVPVIAPYTVIFIDPSEGKAETCARKVKEKNPKSTPSQENSTKERNKPKDQKLLCRPSAAPKRMPA